MEAAMKCKGEVEDLYDDGCFPTQLLTIASTSSSMVNLSTSASSSACSTLKMAKAKKSSATALAPPKPLLVAVPKKEGSYPVLLFFHGFTLLNKYYSQLLQHVASHGFILVAPQMYVLTGADATEEIEDAAAVIDWMPRNLAPSFPEELSVVKPDYGKVGLIGHSRGGKVAFGLALGLAKTCLEFSVVCGLDPVDGKDVGQQTNPPILKFSRHSFNLKFPTLIIGSGLGSIQRNRFFPPCAPEGVSHNAFYFDSSPPAFHLVASEYGHMDFLDDKTPGFQGALSYCVCTNGPKREAMRRFAGGALVAFLRASMRTDDALPFHHLLANPQNAPVKLMPPQSCT